MFSGIIIFFVVRSLWIFYQFLKRKHNYWIARGVVGPKPTFLIGSFPSIINKWRHNLDEISILYEKFKDKAPFIGIYYGLKPALMILDPQIARSIMISDFSHFTDTVGSFSIDKEIDPLIGLNPFFLKGDEWKEKRSEISPAFSNTRIKFIFPLMEKSAIQCIETLLKSNKNLKNLEMREICAEFTTNVVASSVLGVETCKINSYNLRNLSKNVLKPSFRLVYVLFLAPFFPGIAKRLKVKLCRDREENLLKKLFTEAVKNRPEKSRNDFLDTKLFS
ncbi:probable cytochrome P450 28d1 [Culicoides brevitarsis]|uniref:probable cytochrome P450 28d1 n=1 Tax=Culicoides brevitarsis TaxID=469753 RepID=UPI00307BA24E